MPKSEKSAKKQKAKTAPSPKTAPNAPTEEASLPKQAHTSNPHQTERINLPGPDWERWQRNFSIYANNNPAALIAGAIAVILAFMLLF